MRIKPLNKKKSNPKKRVFHNGVFHVEHEQKKAGRLPQLNKALRRKSQ